MSDAEEILNLLEADRWIDRVRQQRTHLPEIADLALVEGELRTLAGRLQALEADRRPAREKFNEAADRAESLRKRRIDLDIKMNDASASPRELTTLQIELERVVAALDDAEDREVGLLLELEPLDDVANEIRSHAAPLATRRHELQEALKELSVSLEEEITHLVLKRTTTAALLSEAVRHRYESALASSGVSGAAKLVDNRCDGCRIALSPLDRDRLRALPANQFFDCPECGRILLAC